MEEDSGGIDGVVTRGAVGAATVSGEDVPSVVEEDGIVGALKPASEASSLFMIHSQKYQQLLKLVYSSEHGLLCSERVNAWNVAKGGRQTGLEVVQV